MRIAIVHNFYSKNSPSGEDLVVLNELSLLQKYGHEVKLIAVYNDNLKRKASKLMTALNLTGFSDRRIRKLENEIKLFNPDIIHIHNLLPGIGFNFLPYLNNYPVVQTLHNYKMYCTNGMLFRNGKICTLCTQRDVQAKNHFNNCYHNKIINYPVSKNIELNLKFGYAEQHIDKYIALTQWQRNFYINQGIAAEKIVIKENFYPYKFSESDRKYGSASKFLFVGRLSEEKGIIELVRNFCSNISSDSGITLTVVGGGPLHAELNKLSLKYPNFIFKGRLSRENVVHLIKSHDCLMVPSQWYEGFPLVITEAIANKIPFAAQGIGNNGYLARKFNCPIFELTDKRLFINLQAKLEKEFNYHQYNKECDTFITEKLQPTKNYQMLLKIYNEMQ